MFGKSSNDGGAAPTRDATRVTTSNVAENMALSGDLDGEGDVVLEGSFSGSIRCRQLKIAESGTLEGSVNAQEVSVGGTVKGEINAKIVRLSATATVEGDVHHEILEVEAGAKVDGHYSRDHRKAVIAPKTELPKEQPPRAPKAEAAKQPVSASGKAAKSNGKSATDVKALTS